MQVVLFWKWFALSKTTVSWYSSSLGVALNGLMSCWKCLGDAGVHLPAPQGADVVINTVSTLVVFKEGDKYVASMRYWTTIPDMALMASPTDLGFVLPK